MTQTSNHGEKVTTTSLQYGCETSPESEKSELWRVGTLCIEYLSLGKTGI